MKWFMPWSLCPLQKSSFSKRTPQSLCRTWGVLFCLLFIPIFAVPVQKYLITIYPFIRIASYRVPLSCITPIPSTSSQEYPDTSYLFLILPRHRLPLRKITTKSVPLLHFTLSPRTSSREYHETNTPSCQYRDTAYRFVRIPSPHHTGLPRYLLNIPN